MASRPLTATRRFLPWDRALLPQAVALLVGGWPGRGPLELGDMLVLVPTRQSGRRLREALAAHAAQFGAALFPPHVMLPETLLAPADPRRVATRTETLLAWVHVLRTVRLDDFRAVLPVDPPARDFNWALGLARQLVAVQHTLVEAGLRIADVVGRVGADFPEADRWRELAELERQFDAVLAHWERQDAPVLRRAQASEPVLPAGISRVLVLAVPDPQPLAIVALSALARRVPVEIVVHAPEAEADSFDAWGRPRPDAWAARHLVLPDCEGRVHLCADPAMEAARVAGLVGRYRATEEAAGIGITDAEVLPELEQALAETGRTAFNPEGRPRQGDRLHQLLGALARMSQVPSFSAAEALARCPDFLAFLSTRLGATFSAARFLAGLDDLHVRHLPATMDAAHDQAVRAGVAQPDSPAARASAGLAIMADTSAALREGTFPDNATTVLATIFAGRSLDRSKPADARIADSAAAWTGVAHELSTALERSGGGTAAEAWELALQLYGETVRYAEKPAGAIELQGWLELLWDDAPHLVVAGLNDGRVPEAIVGDPFLPESLRVRLGLKTNAARLARDAYLLQAMAASRGADGRRLDLLFAKTSAAGDPLRPSRLLLQCADEELAARVRFLFRAPPPPRSMPAWRRAWRLSPPLVPAPARVAVTGLRAWLECPFRFYLSRVRRMQPVDATKTELDVFDFGTLCHAALEAMGRELREETSATRLRDFLLARLEAEVNRRFGSELTLPLIVQLESARQRLARAAEAQARHRADGWVIEQVERPFSIPVGGIEVTGKIDRIDRHETTGMLRVLDYKTSDRPVTPLQAHVRASRRDETAPVLARFTHAGREHVWTDLQLPLYLRAVAADPTLQPGAGLVCAYFNLPKAVGETAIAGWDDYTPELDAAAWRCAEAVASAIRAGEFWPPNEHLAPERDDFAALFHHGVADSVDWPAGKEPR